MGSRCYGSRDYGLPASVAFAPDAGSSSIPYSQPTAGIWVLGVIVFVIFRFSGLWLVLRYLGIVFGLIVIGFIVYWLIFWVAENGFIWIWFIWL